MIPIKSLKNCYNLHISIKKYTIYHGGNMNKKSLVIMLAYVGVIIGAGLASGQELLQYFVSLGIPGLIGQVW